MKLLSKSSVAACVLAISISHGYGAQIAYDGFNYTAASSLNGTSGGGSFGFSAPWLANGGSVVAGSGLSYPGLDVTGNAAIPGAGATNQTDYRTFANLNGTTTWFSFLYQNPDTQNGITGFTIGSGSAVIHAELDITGTNGLFIGQTGPAGFISLTAVGNVDYDLAVAGYNGNDTALIVVELSYTDASSGIINAWVNPSLSSSPGGANLSEPFSLQNLDQIGFISENGDMTADEVRIGTSFASVVPEPSSCGYLASAALLCLVAALWRKRKTGAAA